MPSIAVLKQQRDGRTCLMWMAGYDKCKDLISDYEKRHTPGYDYPGALPTWPLIHQFLENERTKCMAEKSPEKAQLWSIGFDYAHKTCTNARTYKDHQKRKAKQ